MNAVLTACNLKPVVIERLKEDDRSDCCGAPSRVRVQLVSRNLLDFCLHHYEKHAVGLLAKEAEVVQLIPVGEEY